MSFITLLAKGKVKSIEVKFSCAECGVERSEAISGSDVVEGKVIVIKHDEEKCRNTDDIFAMR